MYGDEDFGCQLPLFLMWYHPALTDAVCQEIIEHCNQSVYAARALSDSQKSFFQFAYDKKYKKEYGFMGGREEMIFPHIMGPVPRRSYGNIIIFYIKILVLLLATAILA